MAQRFFLLLSSSGSTVEYGTVLSILSLSGASIWHSAFPFFLLNVPVYVTVLSPSFLMVLVILVHARCSNMVQLPAPACYIPHCSNMLRFPYSIMLRFPCSNMLHFPCSIMLRFPYSIMLRFPCSNMLYFSCSIMLRFPYSIMLRFPCSNMLYFPCSNMLQAPLLQHVTLPHLPHSRFHSPILAMTNHI